eukprot:TRINITY_DN46043_c0_g1_i1.p1 TRINITY_DN46043_c0_g1~~TRINITY_DN46043_c0_g1_i1.p1  ORF type:complete len:458 (+),score=23.60 TRINITY_DN46043_c0_g1_i1:43-1374(+)
MACCDGIGCALACLGRRGTRPAEEPSKRRVDVVIPTVSSKPLPKIMHPHYGTCVTDDGERSDRRRMTRAWLHELPHDVLRRIALYGNVREAVLCGCLCKVWYSLSRDSVTWLEFGDRMLAVSAAMPLPSLTSASERRRNVPSGCHRRSLLADPFGQFESQSDAADAAVRHVGEPADPRERVLWRCRRLCAKCGRMHEQEPTRCAQCGQRWGRPASVTVPNEFLVLRGWHTALGPIQSQLPDEVQLRQGKACFASELHEGSLDVLVANASKDASRFFFATETGCFTLIAIRCGACVVGALTDFPWRSRPSQTCYGEASTSCLIFRISSEGARTYRCRNARGLVCQYTGGSMEFGPGTGGSALVIDGSLKRARSSPSELFGSPSLLDQDSHVSAVLCLSWAYLEGEELAEQVPLALQENQDTFMLNFISSSVRSQLASKAGSAWC